MQPADNEYPPLMERLLVAWTKLATSNPVCDGFASLLCNLELNGMACFLLQDNRPGCDRSYFLPLSSVISDNGIVSREKPKLKK